VTHVIPRPPTDVHECRLVRSLFERSNPADGLAERLETLLRVAEPLLDLVIAGPFRDYTLHNPAHAKKLVHLAEHIMPERTLDLLSPLELTLIIASCYLHDLGMTLTADERQRLLLSPDFSDTLRVWPTISQEIEATRIKALNAAGGDRLGLETRLYQLQEGCVYFATTVQRPLGYRRSWS
jgi:molecular chaperone HtpG